MFKRLLNERPVLRIAFVHLWSKKRQTLVAMLGVMFGITVYIFQAGLITGLQIYMTQKIINNTAHIHIYKDPDIPTRSIIAEEAQDPNLRVELRNPKQIDNQKKLRNARGILEVLQKNPAVQGIAPLVSAQAILRDGIKELPVTISGVDIDKENQLFNLYKEVTAGDIKRLNTISNGIILGHGVAKKLGAEVDEILTMTTANAILDVKVVAITQSGITAVDDGRAYVNIRTAQKILNEDLNYITDLNLKLKDVNQADILADELERLFGYKTQSWKEANSGIFGVFKIQTMATYLVIGSILIVAGFGIFNILMMMIYEKMTDIAILKSLGFRNADIRNLFMIEALVIGFTGGVLGLGLGWLVSTGASLIKVELKGLVTLDHLVINFDPLFYVSGFAFAILSTAAAGYFPARKAARIDPVEIIRGK